MSAIDDDLNELRSLCEWASAELELRSHYINDPDPWLAGVNRKDVEWLTDCLQSALHGRNTIRDLRQLREMKYPAQRVQWALVEACDAVECHFSKYADDLDEHAVYEGPVQASRHPALRRNNAARMCVQLYYLRRIADASTVDQREDLKAKWLAERFVDGPGPAGVWRRGVPVGERLTHVCKLLDMDRRALGEDLIPKSYGAAQQKQKRKKLPSKRALAEGVVGKAIGLSFESVRKLRRKHPQRAR